MKSYVDSNAVLVDLLKENCVLSADYIKLQESLTEEDTDPLYNIMRIWQCHILIIILTITGVVLLLQFSKYDVRSLHHEI